MKYKSQAVAWLLAFAEERKMVLRHLLRRRKNSKFHPSWILMVVALSLLIAGIVWVLAWIVPHLDRKPERLPFVSPAVPKVIMVSIPQAVGLPRSII